MTDELSKADAEPSAGWLGRERIAGVVLVIFGAGALWAGSDLPFMTSGGVGSGLLPRVLSIVIVALGMLQLIVSWKYPGETTGHWALREMVPVILGVILFAATVRGYHLGPITIPALGLSVASPLAIVASGLAARDARIGELLIFAVVLTAFCIGLFRYALGLSIPVAPWLIGY
jgi:Tripartite tricarboxylate transporter TctB family